MKTLKLEGMITALSPVHHGGNEKTGADTLLRRIKYRVGGKDVEIPYIDGNAVRGYLRRLLMQDFLERAGHTVGNLSLYHCLYSGGVLESSEEERSGVLDLALRREIRALIPPVSLLGVSFLNQAFSGKLIVGKMLPCCKELAQFLPEKCRPECTAAACSLLDFEFATRREEEDSREKPREKDEAAVQMIYQYEVFAPGTRFFHHFVLQDTTPLEESCFARMVNLWKERPYIGGRSATGNGELSIDYPPPPQPEAAYLEFIEAKKEDITAILKKMEGMLGPKGGKGGKNGRPEEQEEGRDGAEGG